MTIAAVGALAQSVLGGKSAEKFDPNPGVVFRFKVQIDGLDLGKWQSCSGLKVDFHPTEVKSGGHYTGSRYLPGEMAFPKLVLKRAVIAKHSEKLQKWLKAQGRDWITDASGSGSTATITLLDSYSKPVMKWKLVGVRPAAWSGPELDAKTSGIAIETLELVHEGFQVEVQGAASASAGTGEPSTPKLTGEGGSVVFPFPPKEMKVARTSDKSVSIVGTDGDQPLSTTKADVTTYDLNNLILKEDNLEQNVQLLTTWATTVDSTESSTKVLPDLKFEWGDLKCGDDQAPVRLASVTVTYTRFSRTGKPTRATVTIKLDHVVPRGAEGGANPTSGGLPGRASHLMLESENLQALAHSTYGNTRAWRDVAAANGIDDPLRIAPGTTVYLPAASELPARGAVQ